MTARWWSYELRLDECLDMDWYEIEEPPCGGNTWGLGDFPIAVVDGSLTGYCGEINREMLRKLDAALGKKWGLS